MTVQVGYGIVKSAYLSNAGILLHLHIIETVLYHEKSLDD